jgi:hypothetical protein
MGWTRPLRRSRDVSRVRRRAIGLRPDEGKALSIDTPGGNGKGGDPLQNERDEVGRTHMVDVPTGSRRPGLTGSRAPAEVLRHPSWPTPAPPSRVPASGRVR